MSRKIIVKSKNNDQFRLVFKVSDLNDKLMGVENRWDLPVSDYFLLGHNANEQAIKNFIDKYNKKIGKDDLYLFESLNKSKKVIKEEFVTVKFKGGEYKAHKAPEDLIDVLSKGQKKPGDNFVLVQIADDAPYRWLPLVESKKVIKESFGEQGLTTPEVFNRLTDSDIEKVIKGVIKKSFKDYTLEAYRHQGETEYINLNFCKEEFDVDMKNFEQFERFRIASELATFRQQLFTELSKYLNVVNIKVGPYDYVKGSGYIKFNITILMSDNNISDWVTGIRKKTESKKEFVSESKKTELKEYHYEPAKLKHAEFYYPFEDFKDDLYEKLTDEYNVGLEQAELLLTRFSKAIKDYWYENADNPQMDSLATSIVSKIKKNSSSLQVNEKLDYEKRLKALAKRKGLTYEEIMHDKCYEDYLNSGISEAKVAKAFSTGDKDEFEVKNKLIKKGIQASVIKDKEIKVKWDDKKYSEDYIKSLIESKVRPVLESLYKETIKEARPKSSGVKKPEKPKFVPKTKELDKRTQTSLEKTIKEYNSLSQELEEIEEQFRKSIQKKTDKVSSLESKIYEMMQSVDINLFVVDKIVAKLSTPYTRTNVRYKEVIEEVLKKVNEETKKMIEKLLKSKKFSSSTDIESQLSVVDTNTKPQKRSRKFESVNLNENILNWFKSLFSSFKSYLNNLTSARKQLVSIAKKMNIEL